MSEQALVEYRGTQPPMKIVEDASSKAKILKDIVTKAGLARKFGGDKEHLYFEAWQTIGKFYSSTADVEWTRPIMDGEQIVGYEARARVLDDTGKAVATAEHMCMRDEPNWRDKPLYSLRSMAQTRAASKALRMVFAWVAVLAGYAATPAEEMSENFEKAAPPAHKPKTEKGDVVKCPFCGKQAYPSKFKEGEYYCPEKSCKGYRYSNWPKQPPARTESPVDETSQKPPTDDGWKMAIDALAKSRPDMLERACVELEILTVSTQEQAERILKWVDEVPK